MYLEILETGTPAARKTAATMVIAALVGVMALPILAVGAALVA